MSRLTLFLIFTWIVGCGKPVKQKPNVLFVAVDDMNDWIGVLGNPDVKTPNIDRLAKNGVLFANAHCNAPVCNPSRVSLLTGKHPFNTGIYENHTKMRDKVPDVVTLPQYFRQHGYKVLGGGKIFHDPPPHNYDPESFDEYFWWNEEGSKGAFVGNRWRSPYSVLPDPELPGRPIRKITPLTKRNFDWGAVDQPESDWPDHMVSSWAAEVLERDHTKPFFLAVGIFRPHVPWFNPKFYVDQYPPGSFSLPKIKVDDLDDLGPAAKSRALDSASKHQKVVEFEEWEVAVQAYLASISFADASLGRILKALEESKYANNTIVVFWSDHGYHLGEKGHWHKRTLWERSTHIPLVLSTPNMRRILNIKAPVSLIDVFPTLVELCGLPRKNDLDGRSLVPLIQNPELRWDTPAITTASPGSYSLKDDRWRFIQYANGERELYDHYNDPHEWNNLAGNIRYADIIEDLVTYIPDRDSILPGPEGLNQQLFGIKY